MLYGCDDSEWSDDMREAVTIIADAQAAQEWVAWARGECERLDPLNKPIRMPEDPEPTPEALKPFLGGWSPYGPRGW